MATGLPKSNPAFSRLAAALLAALFQVAFLAAAEPNDQGSRFRTWTDASGQYRTEAAFLGLENGQVRLEKRDGSTTIVAMGRLSDLDQQYVKSQAPLQEVAVEPSEDAGMEAEADAEPAVESLDVEAGPVPPRGSGGVEKPAIEDEPSEPGPEPAESPIGESSDSLETAGGEEKTSAVQPAVADEPPSQPETPQPVGSQPVSPTGKSPVIIVGVVAGAVLILVIVVWGVTRRRRRPASYREYQATLGGRPVTVLDFRQ